jgi:hypothetical protein
MIFPPFIFILLVLAFTMRAEDATLDPSRLEEVRHMAHTVPDDTVYYEGMREEMGAENYDAMRKAIKDKEEARDEFIRTAPDITPYLFFLLDKEYATRQTSFVSIMTAISQRNDLTEAHLEKISSEMNRILEKPYDDMNHSDQEAFLIGGVGILRKFPSPRTEDLTIRVLTRSDEGSWVAGKLAAAHTLALMGTKKSLPYLEKAVDWTVAKKGKDDLEKEYYVSPMQSHHRNLKRRLEGAGPGGSSLASVDSSGSPRSGTAPADVSGHWRNSIYWFLALCGLLVSAVAAYAYRRSRTR